MSEKKIEKFNSSQTSYKLLRNIITRSYITVSIIPHYFAYTIHKFNFAFDSSNILIHQYLYHSPNPSTAYFTFRKRTISLACHLGTTKYASRKTRSVLYSGVYKLERERELRGEIEMRAAYTSGESV